MVCTLLCFLLSGIITLTHGNINYLNEKGAALIPKLSSLKSKYGLNFAHIQGIGSLPKHYKESHPKLTYMDHKPQKLLDTKKPEDYNNIQAYNLLVDAKIKGIMRTDKRYCNDAGDEIRKVLRICRKKPKEYHCSPKNQCGMSKPFRESYEERGSGEDSDKKTRFAKKKKRYIRTDSDKEHDAVDKTAILLDDLEKLLAGNDKYRVTLGCIGSMCGERTSGDGYDEGGDDTEVRREDLRCTGDRCGRNVYDDDDIYVKRY